MLIMVICVFLNFSACKAEEENYEYIEDLLLSQLDWKSDDYLSSLEEGQEDIITIKNIHYGNFSSMDKDELLVLFHIAPHLGGRDHTIAAIYDRATLNIKTQKSLYSDRVSIYVLPYINGRDNILYISNTVYQGVPSYRIELYQIQDNEWLTSPISDYDIDNNNVYAVTDNTLLHIIEINYDEYMSASYKYKYTLYWDSNAGKFIDISDSSSPYLE
jgi:hypothetical protein